MENRAVVKRSKSQRRTRRNRERDIKKVEENGRLRK